MVAKRRKQTPLPQTNYETKKTSAAAGNIPLRRFCVHKGNQVIPLFGNTHNTELGHMLEQAR